MDTNFSYSEAVEALTHALTFGIDPSLGPICSMCAALGDPQRSYVCVQVAGSNGKSSTARMVAALLSAHADKVGLYTSPHLVKYPERIEIDGSVVSDHAFADGIGAACKAARQAGVEATEFELLTAAAFWLFAREAVDVAVLECGLGGRWDATTAADAEVAVITGIALEHTAVLGDTLEAIAAEKACIIKPGTIAVIADGIPKPAAEVIEGRAGEVGARVVHAHNQDADAFGDAIGHLAGYQRANVATALAAAREAFGADLDPKRAAAALAGVAVPGRFEVLREDPLLIVDAAHNPQSASVLAREVKRRFAVTSATSADAATATSQAGEDKPKVPALVLGVLADKDVRGVVEALVPLFDEVVACASCSPRAISPHRLASIVAEVTGKMPVEAATVREALAVLDGKPVLATGSITVAGEVKRIWC